MHCSALGLLAVCWTAAAPLHSHCVLAVRYSVQSVGVSTLQVVVAIGVTLDQGGGRRKLLQRIAFGAFFLGCRFSLICIAISI